MPTRLKFLCSVALIAVSPPVFAAPIAGDRPSTVPGTMRCEGEGVVYVTGYGQPQVAQGGRGPNGLWTITGVDNSGARAICSVPTAASADVECRIDGRAVDRLLCSASEYSKLYAQGLTAISPDGTPPQDLRTANWVLPGSVTNGCVGDWAVTQGATPAACGTVTVTDQVECSATNSQSGVIPANLVNCNPATRPVATRDVEDFRACSIALEPDAWSVWSGDCGPVERTRSVVCEDQRNVGYDLDNAACSQQITDLCAGLPAGQSCTGRSTDNRTLYMKEMSTLVACVAPTAPAAWLTGAWSAPTQTCGSETLTRSVVCSTGPLSSDIVPDEQCINAGVRPAATDPITNFSGCAGVTYCSPTTLLWTRERNGTVNATSCSFANGSCLETSKQTVNSGSGPVTTYNESCFAQGSSVSTSVNDNGASNVRGTNLIYGAEGWCNAADPSSCVTGAQSVSGPACSSFTDVQIYSSAQADCGNVTTSNFQCAPGTRAPLAVVGSAARPRRCGPAVSYADVGCISESQVCNGIPPSTSQACTPGVIFKRAGSAWSQTSGSPLYLGTLPSGGYGGASFPLNVPMTLASDSTVDISGMKAISADAVTCEGAPLPVTNLPACNETSPKYLRTENNTVGGAGSGDGMCMNYGYNMNPSFGGAFTNAANTEYCSPGLLGYSDDNPTSINICTVNGTGNPVTPPPPPVLLGLPKVAGLNFPTCSGSSISGARSFTNLDKKTLDRQASYQQVYDAAPASVQCIQEIFAINPRTGSTYTFQGWSGPANTRTGSQQAPEIVYVVKR